LTGGIIDWSYYWPGVIIAGGIIAELLLTEVLLPRRNWAWPHNILLNKQYYGITTMHNSAIEHVMCNKYAIHVNITNYQSTCEHFKYLFLRIVKGSAYCCVLYFYTINYLRRGFFITIM
jgi:hypothetical protein